MGLAFKNEAREWQAEVLHLQEVANALRDSFIFLEFAIPHMGKRTDAVGQAVERAIGVPQGCSVPIKIVKGGGLEALRLPT